MTFSRRFVLRGALQGAAVAVSMPLLDCFLDGNGTALASGAPLPIRFGTWSWGCGMNPDRWIPTKTGADYDLPVELAPIAPYKQDISILSGFNAFLDGRPNEPHISAVWALRTGTAPIRRDEVDAPSLDVLISNTMGGGTRFRSLDMASTGSAEHTYSRQSASVVNPSEESPMSVYTRIFGSGFQDPNAGEFKPDPKVMVRRSVLSGVAEQRKTLVRDLGVADRQRMEQYFTSIRQLEDQLALQLQKPAPADACVLPKKPSEGPKGAEIEVVATNHKLMTDLLVMALACNQTKAFNMVFSDSASSLRKAGSTVTHHTLTHEEPVDAKLGYQPDATYFVDRSMQAWAQFVGALAAVKEGDGRLLDNMLVYAHSDTSFAKIHALETIPVMFAGRAGGRVKTGLHIAGNGSPVTRTGLTAMTAMRVDLDKWGTKSMETNKVIGELLA
ncbi:MAG: hypothetical protein JWQ29_2956 [Phenylobacterium sp.]|nr:hypothetical protein [Phenylobacterium sp.]